MTNSCWAMALNERLKWGSRLFIQVKTVIVFISFRIICLDTLEL
jgi:hypothetical protein